ncbi:hypothetical protein [Pelotalea chapellei]|uniref:N-acetyltransferase domain-containing protein n=1 Tax=Pelotalea chapellei TaxID=44671 RepID=A0ABS5U4B2_9BACT|nr:hypothetical protein [Pelotalea chapellei]MBT1070500.1 hypothetical protein [Pelotalea chapellei]
MHIAYSRRSNDTPAPGARNFRVVRAQPHTHVSPLATLLGEIISNDAPFDGDGNLPLFNYSRDEDWKAMDHGLQWHPNFRHIRKRPLASFSLCPPFTASQFQLQINDAFTHWKGKKGKHERPGKRSIYDLAEHAPMMAEFRTDMVKKEHPDGTVDIERKIVIGAYDQQHSAVIGYIELELTANADPARKTLAFLVHPRMMWVSPKYRGLGYSVDFGNLCARLARTKYVNAAISIPQEWSLELTVNCDYGSAGGATVSKRIERILDSAREALHEGGCQCVLEAIVFHVNQPLS